MYTGFCASDREYKACGVAILLGIFARAWHFYELAVHQRAPRHISDHDG